MAQPLLKREDVVRQLQQIFPHHNLSVIEKVLQQYGNAENGKFWPLIVNRCIDQLVQIKSIQQGQNLGTRETDILTADQRLVATELKLIFPDYAESLINDCVRNPDNNSEPDGLLQNCIDDLLEGITAVTKSLTQNEDSGRNRKADVQKARGSCATGNAVYREPLSHFDSDDDSDLHSSTTKDLIEKFLQSESEFTADPVENPIHAHGKTPKAEVVNKTTDLNAERTDTVSKPFLVKISGRSIPIPLPPPECSVLSEIASESGLRSKGCASKSDQTVVLDNNDNTKMFEASRGKSEQQQHIKNCEIAGQDQSVDKTKPPENHSNVIQMESKVIHAEDEAADAKCKKSFQEYRNSGIDSIEVSPVSECVHNVVKNKKHTIIIDKQEAADEANLKMFSEYRNSSDTLKMSSSPISKTASLSSDITSGPQFKNKNTNMAFSGDSTSMKSDTFTNIPGPSASACKSCESEQGQRPTIKSEAQIASPEDEIKKSSGNTALVSVVESQDNMKDQNFKRRFLEHSRRESSAKLNLSSDSNSDRSTDLDDLDESFNVVNSPDLVINHVKSRNLSDCRKYLKRKYSSLDSVRNNEKLSEDDSLLRNIKFQFQKFREKYRNDVNQHKKKVKHANLPSSNTSPNSRRTDAMSTPDLHRILIHQSDLNKSVTNMSADTKNQNKTNCALSPQDKAENLPPISTGSSTISPHTYQEGSIVDKDTLYKNILSSFHEGISKIKMQSKLKDKALNTDQSTVLRSTPTLLTNNSGINSKFVLKPTLPCSSVSSDTGLSPTLKTVASVSKDREMLSPPSVLVKNFDKHLADKGKHKIPDHENIRQRALEHEVSQARKTKNVDKETNPFTPKKMRDHALFSGLSDDSDSDDNKGQAVSDFDTDREDDSLPTISFRKKHREKSFNSPGKQMDDLDKKLYKLYASKRKQSFPFRVPDKQNGSSGKEHESIDPLPTYQDGYMHRPEKKQNCLSTIVSTSTSSLPDYSQAKCHEGNKPIQRLPQSKFVRIGDPDNLNKLRTGFSNYRDTSGTSFSDMEEGTPRHQDLRSKPATVLIESTCKITYSPEKYKLDVTNDAGEQAGGIDVTVPTLMGGIPSVSVSFPGASSQMRTSQNYSPRPSQRFQPIPTLHSLSPVTISNTSTVNALPASASSPKMSVNSTRMGPAATQTRQDQHALHKGLPVATSSHTELGVPPQPSVSSNTIKSLNHHSTKTLNKNVIDIVHQYDKSRMAQMEKRAAFQVDANKNEMANKYGTPNTLNPTTNRKQDDDIQIMGYEPSIDITNSPEKDVEDLDVEEAGEIIDVSFERGSTPTWDNDTNMLSQGIHRETDTVEYVETKTPQQMREELKNQVLNVFPDVDLQYLEELCLYNTGNLALNNICFVLSDNKYPRAQPKETIETGKTTKTAPVDYYKHYQSRNLDGELRIRYQRECRDVLHSQFPLTSVADIGKVSAMFKNSYAPTYRALRSAVKQVFDSAMKDGGKPKLLRKNEADVTIELDSSKHTFHMRLLKNKRQSPKLQTLMPELQAEIEFVEKKMKEMATEKDHELAMQLNEQEYETEGQGIECGCCFGEYPFDSMVQCLDGHLFCEGCLRQYAKESVFGQGKAQLLCMTDGCSSTYPKSQLEKALPSEVLLKYEDRVAEESLNLADIGDLVRCPHCDFAAIMDPEDRVFTCLNETCGKETCRYCKENWSEHFGKRCEEIEKKDEVKLRLEYEEKMTKAKVRTCHKCKAQFTKEDGCNKMTCRCSAKMCYICRKPNIDYSHFCQHPRDPGKPCTKCNSCSLWTNPEEDDNRAVAEIQKEAAEARKNKGYTEDKVVGVPEEPPAKRMRKENTV